MCGNVSPCFAGAVCLECISKRTLKGNTMEKHMSTDGPGRITDLGMKLAELFRESERRRRDYEERWIQDLRQYKGQYDPELTARLHPKRSKAFLRLTRTKVRTLDARLSDLLFPGGAEPNWLIEASPVPEPSPAVERELAENMTRELGRTPTNEEMRSAVFRYSKEAAMRMSRVMADQLQEAGYERIAREVIHSGHLYGTGILKGPLVERREAVTWQPSSEHGGDWLPAERPVLHPYMEFVPVWDIYPDLSASGVNDARFIFQRHVLNKHDLQRLIRRPDFDGEAVEHHLKITPDGDLRAKTHEEELRNLGDASSTSGRAADKRYEVLEYWGYAEGRDLLEAGCDIAGDPEHEYAVNVWLLGSTVIKAVPSPFPGSVFPYHFYHYEKDETAFFGEGAAAVMSDPQKLVNASIRAMLDNAAISTGPQLEINQELLMDGEDVTDVHPFRIWLRRGGGSDAGFPAVRVTTLPSHTQEFMAMAEMFMELIDETTAIPSPSKWDESKGAGRTVRGLSMIMNAANAALKEHVRLFDEGITKPFITALYQWNMLFSSREDIKGDYSIKAKGLSSLMAREIHVDQLDVFAQATANSLDAPFINRAELLRRMAAARDLGPGIVKSDEELIVETKAAKEG